MSRSVSPYLLGFGLSLLGGLVWEGYQILLWRLVQRPHSGLGLILSGVVGLGSFVAWLLIQPGYNWLGLIGLALLVSVMFGYVLYSYRRRGAVSRPSAYVVWPAHIGTSTRIVVGFLAFIFVVGGSWQFVTATSPSEYFAGVAVVAFGIICTSAAVRGKSPSWLAEESAAAVKERSRMP